MLIAPPNNSMAFAGFILGVATAAVALIGGMLFSDSGLFGIVAVSAFVALPALLALIFGFIGISTANRMGGKRRTKAIWAVVLGFTPILFALIGSLLKPALLG